MIVVGGAVCYWAGEYAVWWLFNSTPPTVSLEAPSGAVRGNVTLGVRVGPEGRAGPIEATIDDKPLTAGSQVLVETQSLPTVRTVRVVAEDRSFRKNRAEATVTLTTDNTPPKLLLESQPPTVQQGHTWLLRDPHRRAAAVEARFGDRDLPIEQGNGYGWAVVGFSPTANVTTVPAVVTGATSPATSPRRARRSRSPPSSSPRTRSRWSDARRAAGL